VELKHPATVLITGATGGIGAAFFPKCAGGAPAYTAKDRLIGVFASIASTATGAHAARRCRAALAP